MMISVNRKVENIVGKEAIAGYQHFILFLQSFQKLSFLELIAQHFSPCWGILNKSNLDIAFLMLIGN